MMKLHAALCIAMSTMSRSGARSATTSDSMTGPNLSTIDDVISYVRSFDLNNENGSSIGISETLLPALNKTSTQAKGRGRAIFTSLLQGDIDPLEMLDPAANTLGYAFILAHRLNASDDQGHAQVLMSHVARFAQDLNFEQLLGAGEVVTLLVKGIVHISELCKDLVWANPSLLRIFDGFRVIHGGVNNLTTLHSLVLYHLLRTAHFETAFDWILRHDVVAADTRFSPLAYTDVLQYFYYAGLILIKLRSYEQACFMLEQCVCAPAQTISVIQMDAYKKLILVQLMHLGETRTLPSQASPSIQRSVRGRVANIEAYHALSRAICQEHMLSLMNGDEQSGKGKSSNDTLEQAVRAGHDTFTRDQNLGLVNRLVKQHLRRRLHRLSKHFVRLSLGDLARLLGPTDTIHDVPQTIYSELVKAQQQDWLRFTVKGNTDAVQSTTVVTFQESVKDFTSVKAAQVMLATVKESQRWGKLVQDKEKALKSSEAYLSKLLQPGRDRALFATSDDFDDDAFA